MSAPIDTVLFDLDGTLIDTAPDMARALNLLRQEMGHSPLPLPQIREQVSHGARALLELGFSDTPEAERESLRQRLLAHYRQALSLESCLFPGMDELLRTLERSNIRWGVVTNKPGWLTEPLMVELNLADRAACIVSGDTTPRAKPDPMPIMHACESLAAMPARCVYVGDAERDIIAGRAAGMPTYVALFGYLSANDQPDAWGATALLERPQDLLDHLQLPLADVETG